MSRKLKLSATLFSNELPSKIFEQPDINKWYKIYTWSAEHESPSLISCGVLYQLEKNQTGQCVAPTRQQTHDLYCKSAFIRTFNSSAHIV